MLTCYDSRSLRCSWNPGEAPESGLPQPPPEPPVDDCFSRYNHGVLDGIMPPAPEPPRPEDRP